MKILLNAESFGFGPSAALSAIFPYIKKIFNITQLDYIGEGHSIDLQRNLPYDNIIIASKKEDFINIVKQYDIFITSLDFEKAIWAQEVKIPTIIYDTLLWYWRKIPNSLLNAHTYITQDFYGVKEKIENLQLSNSYIVSPIIKAINKYEKLEKEVILINFGGLENPYWTIDITYNYIKSILTILIPLLKTHNKQIKITCSKSHIQKHINLTGSTLITGYHLENFSYEVMQQYLSKTYLLFATPGLGNIYECANYQMPTIFLPPVNDSQGQQLEILKEKELINAYIDWNLLQYGNIDYFQLQLSVLETINEAIHYLEKKELSKATIVEIQKIIDNCVKNKGNARLNELINQFGINGLEQVGLIIQNAIEEISKGKKA